VTAERTPATLEVIAQAATEAGASLLVIDRDFAVVDNRIAVGGRFVSLRTSARSYEDVLLSLHGSHQAVNAAVALEAVAQLLPSRPLEQSIVEEAFGAAVVPARLEAVNARDGEGPTVVLDVAHNPDGASVLVRGLRETFPFERVVFVLGMLEDKDYAGVLTELARLPCSLVVTQPTGSRGLSVERLQAAAREIGLEAVSSSSVNDAVGRALQAATDDELVCVTGSHYVVGEARAGLEKISGGRYAAPPIAGVSTASAEGS
jgi:dihydrofolate synthase / folylpolyglutamate synthase